MNMRQWFADAISAPVKKAMPILSFPSTSLLGVSVRELISDSTLQAKGMKAIADRCDMPAAVSMMDLSVEAEAFGASILTDDNEVPTVIGSVVSGAADADSLKVPAVGAARTGLYVETIAKACALINDRPVFAGVIGPFSLAGRLMDLTQVIFNCYDEPGMVHTTLAKATEFTINYVGAYKKAGAHGIVMAEPAAGLLTPDLIDEFSTPYVNRIIDAVQTDDFAVIYHNCGNTIPLIDSIRKINSYGYHFGNIIDLSAMIPLIPAHKTVMGNVDPSSQFRNGTPGSIYKATHDVIGACAKYPNFIISSGCDIPPLAPWENIDAFFKAVDDFYDKQ